MGKQGRLKFADVWVNQTTLGKQFGLSAIAMGKKLKELGLRSDDGNPTTLALSNGLGDGAQDQRRHALRPSRSFHPRED